MSNEFATVLTSWSVEETHLARIRLADEDIESHLADEMTVGMVWNHANALHGVKLLVKSEDAARAREILNQEHLSDAAADIIPAESWPEIPEENDLDNRPNDGTLTALRSIRRPVIWFFLAPTFLRYALDALGL